ncbi:TonB-dependent receptor domain-containing protein [Flavitalea sp.]|nr:TonB-dependent receptor [Flavitalea sp.]
MKQLSLLLAVIILFASSLSAQSAKSATAVLNGNVTTSDGKPAAGVSVRLLKSKWSAITNENGKFSIRNITPGSYKLSVSAVANAAQEKELTISAGETIQQDFILSESAQQLEAVVVSSRLLNKRNAFVAKMPLKNMENPQVYSTVISEILKQQAILNYDDAMRNIPGITRTWESTGRSGDGGSYFALRGFDAQPTLINGLPGLTSGNLDPANMEEIQAPVYLTSASIDNLLAGTASANSNIVNSSYSAYVSDVINITSGLMAMLSLRADYFDSKGEKSTKEDDFNQWALSPKFGLIWQPVPDKVSVFGNYMNAFINVAPQQVADADGSNVRVKSFEPEQANQWEFGVKTNLMSDKLFATVSFYDIRVSNRVSPDPTNINNVLQGGKVGSKGFEIDINANPYPGFNLIAGYSYNQTKVIAGDEEDFYAEPGRAPGGQGPQNLANIWATYKLLSGKLKNFGIGIGGNYASEYKVIDNSKTGNFYLPSYSLLNTSLFYNGDRFRITVNVNNLADKRYYIGYWSVNPQKPRNFAVSMACKF